MKATAKAHPIQGLVKYHGMHDEELRLPYHDSISVCTAPSHSKTTVEFDLGREADRYVVDGEAVEGRGAERIQSVVDCVREKAGLEARVRFESVNDFSTNIGFGSSASGFAAAAVALCAAAGLDLTRPEMSAVARRGSASAAKPDAEEPKPMFVGKSLTDSKRTRASRPASSRTRSTTDWMRSAPRPSTASPSTT